MSQPSAPMVLLVDDDRDVVQGSKLRLTAAGYDTLAAYDGEEGVEMASRRHPDAIVLDVRMPHRDGLSALADLRSQPETKDIPVVMLSASLRDQRSALEAGARFFVRKPYNGENLIEAVNKAIHESTQPPEHQ